MLLKVVSKLQRAQPEVDLTCIAYYVGLNHSEIIGLSGVQVSDPSGSVCEPNVCSNDIYTWRVSRYFFVS